MSEIHPHRFSSGVQANFYDGDADQHVILESFFHSQLSIKNACILAGFNNSLTKDVYGTEELIKLNQDWRKHLNQPLIQSGSLRKSRNS
ncbi:MAG: hypothetical protein KA715_02785 [Xanthomonadaceae bacterium]|nr:hypothetical protein [Xanthomonadaceae bacterium]